MSLSASLLRLACRRSSSAARSLINAITQLEECRIIIVGRTRQQASENESNSYAFNWDANRWVTRRARAAAPQGERIGYGMVNATQRNSENSAP